MEEKSGIEKNGWSSSERRRLYLEDGLRRLLLSTVEIYRGVATIDREFISTEQRVSSLYFAFKIRVLSRGTGPRVVSRLVVGRAFNLFNRALNLFVRSNTKFIYRPRGDNGETKRRNVLYDAWKSVVLYLSRRSCNDLK